MAPTTDKGRVRPLLVVIPLILSIAGFVLAMLALFAGTGSQQQEMEDFHIIAINMSNFGHDLVPTPSSTQSAEPQATETGFFDSIFDDVEDKVDEIKDDVSEYLNDIANDVADELAERIGIKEWYSLHVMTMCEGYFAPNATAPDAWYNTTNCTDRQAGVQFNLTDIIDRQISEGPLAELGIDGNDLRLPDQIQETINYINDFLLAIFILYVLGAGFSGLSFLVCIALLGLRRNIGRGLILVNMVLALLAALALAVGSAIATAIAKKGESEINERGDEIGISANAGTKFMIITWVAFAVMFLALLFWTASCCFPRRSRAAAVHEKHWRGSGETAREDQRRHRSMRRARWWPFRRTARTTTTTV